MFNTRGWIALGLLSAFALPGCSVVSRSVSNQHRHHGQPGTTIWSRVQRATYPHQQHHPLTPPTTRRVRPVRERRHQVPADLRRRTVYATMGDGTQTYLFSFGPLVGASAHRAGLTWYGIPNIFNTRIRCRPATPWCPVIRPRPGRCKPEPDFGRVHPTAYANPAFETRGRL